jgi:hypothetical protein
MNAKFLSLFGAICVAAVFSLAMSRFEKRNDEKSFSSTKESADVKFVTERNPYMRSER